MKSVLQFHVVFLISCLPLCTFFILKYLSNVFTLKLLNSSLVFILLFDFWPIQIVNLNLVSKELIFWFHFRASLSSQTVLKWILELIWDALPLFTIHLRESPSAETLYFISVFIHRHFSSIFRKKKQNRNLLHRGHSKKERVNKRVCNSSTWQESDSFFPQSPSLEFQLVQSLGNM